MSEERKQTEELLSRLDALEKSDAIKTKEMFNLEKQLFEHQRKMFTFEKESDSLKQKIDVLEQTIDNLKTQMAGSSDLTIEMTSVESIIQRLDVCESKAQELEIQVADTKDLATKRSNLDAKMQRVDACEKQMKTLDRRVSANKEFITTKATKLESVTQRADACEKNTEALEKKVAANDKALKTKLFLLNEKMQKVEEFQKKTEQLEIKVGADNKELKGKLSTLQTKMKAVESQIDHLNSLRRILNRVMVQCQSEALEKKVYRLEKQTKILQGHYDKFAQSYTSLKIETSKPLNTAEHIEMDTCVGIYKNGMFDTRFGSLVTKFRGWHVLIIRFKQREKGLIRVYWNASHSRGLGAQTDTDNNETCNVSVMYLDKGEKLQLEALRVKGSAKVEWCYLNFWFLCPS